jgi:hypothetical protein
MERRQAAGNLRPACADLEPTVFRLQFGLSADAVERICLENLIRLII